MLVLRMEQGSDLQPCVQSLLISPRRWYLYTGSSTFVGPLVDGDCRKLRWHRFQQLQYEVSYDEYIK